MPRSLGAPLHRFLVELPIQYRLQAGLKQADAAGHLGRHQPFISGIESGRRRLDVVELVEIADAIGFDAAELVKELQVGQRRSVDPT